MEFVHHDVRDGKHFAFAQRHVRKNFGGTANDGGIAVDGCISGRKSDVLGAEFLAERHPLFVYERLDGTGVNASAAMYETVKMERKCDHGFPASGRRVENNIFTVQKFENRFFLRWI